VISDRLHGGLIAAMMRKKVVFLPVGYHKIQSFYDTWLQKRPSIAFVSSSQELMGKISALHSYSDDLHVFFREYADPALNHFLLGSH
jgi:exopolysaccharide biosynthesis predicted pyruvyltransferase EpsI